VFSPDAPLTLIGIIEPEDQKEPAKAGSFLHIATCRWALAVTAWAPLGAGLLTPLRHRPRTPGRQPRAGIGGTWPTLTCRCLESQVVHAPPAARKLWRQKDAQRFDLIVFVPPGHKRAAKSRYLQAFFSKRLGHGFGPRDIAARLSRQRTVPICRHFKRRERRGSNPHFPNVTVRRPTRRGSCTSVR
jgi:hypothetical protein